MFLTQITDESKLLATHDLTLWNKLKWPLEDRTHTQWWPIEIVSCRVTIRTYQWIMRRIDHDHLSFRIKFRRQFFFINYPIGTGHSYFVFSIFFQYQRHEHRLTARLSNLFFLKIIQLDKWFYWEHFCKLSVNFPSVRNSRRTALWWSLHHLD